MMNPLDPFGRSTGGKTKISVAGKSDAAADPAQFVIRRKEDGKYLGNDDKPTSDLSNAEVHDGRAMAALWAERASKAKPGNWEAIPHPGLDDPDDFYPEAA